MNVFAGDISEQFASLWKSEIVHCIKVLRHRMGDEIVICNGKGRAIQGSIIEIGKNEVLVEIHESIELPSQTSGIHIAMAPTKNIDRFEFFIEKATELGVAQITPILSFHSERKNIRLDKLQKKALAASTQSLRSEFIHLHDITPLPELVEKYSAHSIYIAHCSTEFERSEIQEITFKSGDIVLIGPEGDFSKEEISQLYKRPNIKGISLGPNRLRTETAGIFVASELYRML